jgi:hypothetical protein
MRALPSTFYAATAADLIADIRAASKHGGANTIVLTAPTTSPYVLTAVDNTRDGATGLPVIKSGDSLTIVGNGDTIERASGAPSFRLFDVASTGSLTLQNLTLHNGLAFGSGVSAEGGAIYNAGTLTLIGATVQSNTAQGSDGAIVLNKKTIQVQPGADAAGGGIWSSGSVTLQGGTTIQGNLAFGGKGGTITVGAATGGTGGGGLGGGLYEAGGSVTITSATLTGNTALGGAGGDCYVSYPAASGNGGIGAGGGLYVANGTLNMGDPLGLSSVTVQSNLAQGGTGGYDWNGYYSFSYSFPSGKGGTGAGGGIAIASGTATLTFVNVLSNTAQGGTGGAGGGDWGGGAGGNAYGGGLYSGGGTVTLTNDTVTGNQARGGDPGPGYYGWGVFTPGYGYGDGIYIVSGATVYIDSFTVAHSGWIDGTYILLP